MTQSDNIPLPPSECSIFNISTPIEESQQKRWYVMRDLKRPNAKLPAYKMLMEKQFEVFTPMKWQVAVKRDKRVREEIPFIRDLLFVHSERAPLDLIVEQTPTLQYRFAKGGGYREPMVVRDEDMSRFMAAVGSTESPIYYSPEEITPDMIGRQAHVIGGALNGYEVTLQKIKGSRKKRIFVMLPALIVASVEIEPDFLQFI